MWALCVLSLEGKGRRLHLIVPHHGIPGPGEGQRGLGGAAASTDVGPFPRYSLRHQGKALSHPKGWAVPMSYLQASESIPHRDVSAPSSVMQGAGCCSEPQNREDAMNPKEG